MVLQNASMNLFQQNRDRMHDFPTPESPIMSNFKNYSDIINSVYLVIINRNQRITLKLIQFYQVSMRPQVILSINQFFLNIFYNLAMNTTFLDKFQGKTKTITKQGPQYLLKGSTNAQIYTNTHKSFGPMRSPKFSTVNKTAEEQPKQQSESNRQQKKSLHLPAIGQRYLSHKNQIFEISHRGPLRGYIDRQTNWLIQKQYKLANTEQQIVETRQKVIKTQKQNIQKVEKTIQSKKRYNSSSKYSRLGGLGPNIGCPDWQLRRSKQQKALNYAKQVNKIQRKKMHRSQQDEERSRLFNNNNKGSIL